MRKFALIAALLPSLVAACAPVAPLPGVPTANAGTPTPAYAAGKLAFSPETIVDPQRTEGEPHEGERGSRAGHEASENAAVARGERGGAPDQQRLRLYFT